MVKIFNTKKFNELSINTSVTDIVEVYKKVSRIIFNGEYAPEEERYFSFYRYRLKSFLDANGRLLNDAEYLKKEHNEMRYLKGLNDVGIRSIL